MKGDERKSVAATQGGCHFFNLKGGGKRGARKIHLADDREEPLCGDDYIFSGPGRKSLI